MKVVENSPQIPRNCTILKKFLGGACPQTPLTKARSFAARDMPLCGMYIQNPRNFKVGPPPPGKSCIRPCVDKCLRYILFENGSFREITSSFDGICSVLHLEPRLFHAF